MAFSYLRTLLLVGLMVCPALTLNAQEGNNPCISVLPELSAAALGSFSERQSKFKTIIEKCPGLAEARYNYGVLLLENNDSASAIGQFEEAVRLRDEPEYRLGLASALLAHGDLLTAKNSYESILSKDPRAIRALLGLATIAEKSGNATESLQFLNKAYEVEPENTFVNYNLGVIYDRLDQTEAAIVSFERALKANPRHFPAQLFLGIALKKMGRDEEALSSLKKAADLPDATVDGIRAYAFELEELGSLDEAEVILRRALVGHPGDAQILEQLAVVLLRKNQESNAKPFLEQLLVKKASEPRLLALYGWTQFRLGDLVGAEKSLKEATIKDPSASFGFFALGELYRQSGQLDLSKSNLDTAYNLDPSLKEKSNEWWKIWDD